MEAVNKTIKENLKKKLEQLKGAWIDELLKVLWAYQTTCITTTEETPFSLVYGMATKLDLLEQKRKHAYIKTASRNQIVAQYYNKRVKPRTLKVGDMVLKKAITQVPGQDSFGPKWEGLFCVIGIVHPGQGFFGPQWLT
ncbi:hypothetical protein TIFTF001_027178 [Ficus carica]|uniref:Uncharacterized protein n=1 Tax=Ficus carica TaxID=3494 RepID=A0AA88DMH5_FICCA|nr:hypothetical protein TIFTF001_027178 [Ficus carica]